MINISFHDFKTILAIVLIAIYVAALVYKWRN